MYFFNIIQDAPEVLAPTDPTDPEATPSAPPPQEWQTQQEDVSKWLRSDEDVSRWVPKEDVSDCTHTHAHMHTHTNTHTQDAAKWCHNPDVSHLVPRHWDGPKTPATPMERLVSMGFADRNLNDRLLKKYNNSLPAVLNELLDSHQQTYGLGGGVVSDSVNV